jgi:hypothetical protein
MSTPETEHVAREWLAKKAVVTELSQQRTAANKELKEVEKRLHALLRGDGSGEVTVDGHKILLVTSVKEESQ